MSIIMPDWMRVEIDRRGTPRLDHQPGMVEVIPTVIIGRGRHPVCGSFEFSMTCGIEESDPAYPPELFERLCQLFVDHLVHGMDRLATLKREQS